MYLLQDLNNYNYIILYIITRNYTEEKEYEKTYRVTLMIPRGVNLTPLRGVASSPKKCVVFRL